MKVLGILFGWLANRWVISFLGVLLLVLLIWFVGPLIAFAGWEPLGSVDARLVTIIIIVTAWLVKTVWTVIRTRKTNAEMVEGLAAAPEDQASEEELALLRDRFKEALAVLKKAKLGGRGPKRQLYQLPWYLIIGPPGAGKTTALKNSGLKFPLMEHFGQDAIRGVGGTRNCDWWFTDEAVILDTAGRYTTQDSDQAVDSAAWGGFLQLLKKHRRRRPVDGVIVAFSLLELTQQGREERRLHAQAVRKRLQELSNQLKVKVPVYIVFTKCDLVAGFIEFFDDLGRDERGQVWGATFPIAESEKATGAIDSFGDEFDILMDRLDTRLLARLDEERDLHRRGAIQGFTQQMASLKGALQEFLTETFQPSRYEEPCLVRGVYLSSGTQEGTPIDRVISSIAGTFGFDRQSMPAFSGPGRSYFLTRLLREVVFQEADLVGHTGLIHQYRAWFQRAAYGGAALLAVGLVLAWSTSYLGNQGYISDVEAQVAEYEQAAEALASGSGSIVEMLIPLHRLRSLPGGYDDRDKSVPLILSLGLYQGDKLGDAAIGAYRRALNTVLLPRVVERMEAQMGEFASHSDRLYAALKAYLMLGNPKFLDRKFVRFWITLDWNTRMPGPANAVLREQLENHVIAMLDSDMTPPTLSASLVSQAREILARRPLAERVYGQVKQTVGKGGLVPWRITDKISDADRYFRRKSGKPLSEGLPAIFTYSGYKDEFLVNVSEEARTASQETWVIGPEYGKQIGNTELPALIRDVEALYFEEYIHQWEGLMADVDIIGFRGFGDGVEVLNALSAPTSPIKGLLKAFAVETELMKSPILGALKEKGAEKGANVKDKLAALLDLAPGPPAEPTLDDPSTIVDRRFGPIRLLLKGKNDSPAPIERVLTTLNTLYEQVSLMRNRGGAPPSPDSLEALSRIQLDAQRQPDPLRRWMLSLARESSSVTVASVHNRLNRVWQADLAPYCQRAIGNRYPLARNSAQDANLNDFSLFFGPQGKVDNFFNQYLQPYVDTSVRPWRALSSGGAKIGIGSEVLSQFEGAARIREAFFPDSSGRPVIKFQIRPITLDKQARHALLEFGDQKLTYRHGPTRLIDMQWPPPAGAPRAKVVITPTGDRRPVQLTAEGPWSFFRLLDKGRVRPGSQTDRFRITFDINGLKATYEILAGSVTNPFRLGAIGGFRCLSKL